MCSSMMVAIPCVETSSGAQQTTMESRDLSTLDHRFELSKIELVICIFVVCLDDLCDLLVSHCLAKLFKCVFQFLAVDLPAFINIDRIESFPEDLIRHPCWLAPCLACIYSSRAELLLDAQKLVVLGIAVGAARSAGLDLASTQANSEIRNCGVLSLARAVRSHHAPAFILAHFHRVDGFSHGSNLVHLQQQSIACFLIDGRLH